MRRALHPVFSFAALMSLLSLASACDVAATAQPRTTPRADTDEPPSYAFTHAGRALHGKAALALDDGRALLVDDANALVLVDGARRTQLLDGVREVAALKPHDGEGARVVASRTTDLGESDLWIVRLDRKEPPRAIAAAKGADTSPVVLDDGRVVFTSTRTGVASLFVVSLDGTGLRQITNVDAKRGALGDAFVPTPVGDVVADGARVTYDAGDATWTVDVDTGAAVKEGA